MTYKTISHSLSVSINLVFTILICLRIFIMRDKAVKVLGKLQASFYSSSITMFVESGGFFTIWSTVYLIALLSDSWVEDVFLQPYSYILVSAFFYNTQSSLFGTKILSLLPPPLGNYQDAYNHENGSRSCLVKRHHRSSFRWRTRLANFFNKHWQYCSSQLEWIRTFFKSTLPKLITQVYRKSQSHIQALNNNAHYFFLFSENFWHARALFAQKKWFFFLIFFLSIL